MEKVFKTFVPHGINISLEWVVTYLPQPQSVQTANLKNDPPAIFVDYSPAVLLRNAVSRQIFSYIYSPETGAWFHIVTS